MCVEFVSRALSSLAGKWFLSILFIYLCYTAEDVWVGGKRPSAQDFEQG